MERTGRILFGVVIWCIAALWAHAQADRQFPKATDDSPPREAAREETEVHLGPGPLHSVIIERGDVALLERVRASGGIVREIDYGAFRHVVLDERNSGGLATLLDRGLPIDDTMDIIRVNGLPIDGAHPDAAYRSIDPALVIGAAHGVDLDQGLYLVQFSGPIQDAWLEPILAFGAEIITYIPANAYVFSMSPAVAAAFTNHRASHPEILFFDVWQPAFRLSPELRRAAIKKTGARKNVTIQCVANPAGERAAIELRGLAQEVTEPNAVGPYLNVRATITDDLLLSLAQSPAIFAIEESGTRKLLDERQGQILAGNVSGATVTAPGYLAWLAAKGFTASQFGTFSVNVVDDATSLLGHPDLANARVAFTQNPTGQTGKQGGHGFLNAHIIGGMNTGTGSAFVDAAGFHYGLGIAPFAQVGSTAIFGSGSSTPTAWESAAYALGARISSNSWGYSNSYGGPLADYDASAQEFDFRVRDARATVAGNQELTVVFAAGNDGAGPDTVSSPATAKNVITVGASENDRQTGTDGCGTGNVEANDVRDIASFSSRGPVNKYGGDGRLKPDLVAPGTHIEAGVPQTNYNGQSVCDKYFPGGQTLYGWSTGTSHSCPAVAGASALVYQWFLNQGRPAPSPAMVKAWLMNSTEYMTGAGAGDTLPSASQGMGRVNLGRAFDGVARIAMDQTRTFAMSGQSLTIDANVVDTTKPLRVTLAWTDVPGPTTGAPWVNDLDLTVSFGATIYRGNVFAGQLSQTGGVADKKNNVESIWLPAGMPSTFQITVSAKTISGDGVPGNGDFTDQDFALVVWNAIERPVPPVAQFAATPTTGVGPLTVNFTDQTTGNVTAWAWNFGDGQTASVKNPTHLYTQTGNYTVTLTATGPGGAHTVTKTNYVHVAAIGAPRIYMTFTAGTTLPGIGAVADEDIVAYDTSSGSWSIFFDGSDVGLSTVDIDAFSILANGSIAMSFDATTFSLPGLVGGPNGTTVTDHDIVVFTPTSTGTTTAGTFTFLFDGAAVGLTATTEDIDALYIAPTGEIYVSTTGNPTVPGLSSLADEDILRFAPTSTGAVTSGTWSLYFDGSDVGLDGTTEDVDGIDFDSSGNLYFSCGGAISVTGVTADDEDIVKFVGTFGPTTAGTFTLAYDLSSFGVLTAADVDDIFIAND